MEVLFFLSPWVYNELRFTIKGQSIINKRDIDKCLQFRHKV